MTVGTECLCLSSLRRHQQSEHMASVPAIFPAKGKDPSVCDNRSVGAGVGPHQPPDDRATVHLPSLPKYAPSPAAPVQVGQSFPLMFICDLRQVAAPLARNKLRAQKANPHSERQQGNPVPRTAENTED